MDKKNAITTIVLVVVFSGFGFFAGMKYQQKRSPDFRAQFQNGMMRRDMGGIPGNNNQRGRMGGGMTIGEIISVDEKSITVKMPDGSSKIVLLSNNTSINKSSLGIVADLKNGEKVSVFGTSNSDGSMTAQNIQLNPMERNQPSVAPTIK